MSMPADQHELVLTGLDGANPLGFLAAVGTLRTLALSCVDNPPRMSWRSIGGWRPVLHSPFANGNALATKLDGLLRSRNAALQIADDPGMPAKIFRHKADEFRQKDPAAASLLAALASDAVITTNSKKQDVCQDTAFRTMSGAGHQHLLAFARNICSACTRNHLQRDLFETWRYDDPVQNHTLRLDPLDDVRYALRWRDPSGYPARTTRGSVYGASRLAIEALPLFPCMPRDRALCTAGFLEDRRAGVRLRWPIWAPPLSLDAVRSLLTLPEVLSDRADADALRERCAVERYASRRVTVGKFRSFSPARPV